jgi:hypothetical protein
MTCLVILSKYARPSIFIFFIIYVMNLLQDTNVANSVYRWPKTQAWNSSPLQSFLTSQSVEFINRADISEALTVSFTLGLTFWKSYVLTVCFSAYHSRFQAVCCAHICKHDISLVLCKPTTCFVGISVVVAIFTQQKLRMNKTFLLRLLEFFIDLFNDSVSTEKSRDFKRKYDELHKFDVNKIFGRSCCSLYRATLLEFLWEVVNEKNTKWHNLLSEIWNWNV